MIKETVWGEYIKPKKIFGNLYFVGIRAVCTHLVDTGDGLIIIDPGYRESLHIIIHNIWELGFNPMDIKYIVASHAHFDHMDSVSDLAEMTGAKTFIGKGDLPLLLGETYQYPIRSFKPDVLLEDEDMIALGNTRIRCVSTPGHTDGTISFFFDVTDGKKTYRAGMFGGAGSNTLRKKFMIDHNIPFENRQKMMNSIKRLQNEKVEIFLGNHLEDNNTEEKLNTIEAGYENPFLKNGQAEWDAFLAKRLILINNIIKEDL